ncbi:MAG: alpha/beta hydrolase, partial [Burkholderiaceae bacterium]
MLDLLYPPLDWRDWRDDWPLASCSRFVKAGGVRWHVQQQGRGPVMLLLHGTRASTHTWRDHMPVWA